MLDVSLFFGDADVVRVGRLARDARGVGAFEYASDFLKTTLRIDPYRKARGPGLIRSTNPRDTAYVPGMFADGLPDAWGRLLVERKLREANRWNGPPNAFEELAIVGRRGRGALVSEPALHAAEASPMSIDLELLRADADAVLAGVERATVARLEALAGSSGGARPKVNVALDAAGHVLSTDGALPAGFTHWIVKFPSSADEFREATILEAAYARAAAAAGIAMPRTRLLPSRDPARPYYAIERFDRKPDGSCRHMLSAAGALEIDWTVPNVSYENLCALARIITRDEGDVREMIRRMIFNVLAHNRDDHAKQHSFVMDRDGTWHVAPAYDLTPSRGPGGYHYATVNGKGSDIERSDLLAVATEQSLSKAEDNALVDDVARAVRALPQTARDLGASKTASDDIARLTSATLDAAR